MEVFIDTANIAEVRKWVDIGIIDGVTTNPSIMLKDGVYDLEQCTRDIAALIGARPLCVEVTTNDLDKMLEQARTFASWAPNIVAKIPQTNQDGAPCHGVIRRLEGEGVRVNATAALSFGQVIASVKVGATYVSLFGGRIADEGGDPSETIRTAVQWVERWAYRSKIVVGSMRSVGDVLSAVRAGAHVVTVPPPFLGKMVDHKYTRETVKQFIDDAHKSLEVMARMTQRPERVAQAPAGQSSPAAERGEVRSS